MIILIITIAVSGLIIKNKDKKSSSSSNSTPVPTININYTNFADVLSGSSLVGTLPKGSTLLLRFYNFNSGKREWEKSYVMKRGLVVEGISEADITFILHSKYLDTLTNKNFCSVIKTAKENGDLSIETALSKTALLWEFKSMYKYRKCLGF